MAKAKEMQESESSRQNQGQQNQTGSGAQQGSSSPAMTRGGERQQGMIRREPFGLSSWMSDPFSMMDRFAEEMDHIFEGFGIGRGRTPRFGQLFTRGQGGTTLWSPQVEMFEREGQLCV